MLHVASTALLTFYRVCAKRGSLLANVVGIVVHDLWKPYYTMQSVLHVLCNAHHLRELKALVEIEKEDWARKMQWLLRRACHAANLARERSVPLKPPSVTPPSPGISVWYESYLTDLTARRVWSIHRELTGSSLSVTRLSRIVAQRASRSRAYANASSSVSKRAGSLSHSPESSVITSTFQDMVPLPSNG
jgi:hypothetical protein